MDCITDGTEYLNREGEDKNHCDGYYVLGIWLWFRLDFCVSDSYILINECCDQRATYIT